MSESENTAQDFTAEDLKSLDHLDVEDATANDDADSKPEPAKPSENKAGKTLLGEGDREPEADTDAKEKSVKEPAKAKEEDVQNWREELAKHYAAGDAKTYKRELRRLERISDQKHIYGMYRDLEAKFSEGGLIKVPGKDAKPEDIEQFNKALGVPEKAEEYYKDLSLENGAIVGEADKPFVENFAEHMHKHNARPGEFKAAINWYYAQQEAQAAQVDEEDDNHRTDAERQLKEDFGQSYQRRLTAISSLFATAEGGTDLRNDNSVYARLMGGRTADGRLIGNDPTILKWLDSMRSEINPAASVVEDGNQSGQSLNQEIKDIEEKMKTDRKAYFKDEDMQARYRELITAREKIRAKA